jgi:NAD+ synthase
MSYKSAMKELAERLSSWIKEQVIKAGGQGVIVGLSGGLDSSVVAVLCKKAFPENMLGVLMPCQSSKMDLDHAQEVVQRFDIPTKIVALDEIFDVLLKALPGEGLAPQTRRLAEANLKPRLRMLTLYYLANRLNYLVAGTGNKSELAVGYFTKHGDGGVDILPIGNLVKGQVRELAGYLGIPEEILGKPPSGGLWAGQTDEEEMGITYEELDRYLTTRRASGRALKRVRSLARASAHKKRLPPIPP